MVIFGYVIIGLSIIGLIICFIDFDAGAPVIILLVLVFALGFAFINYESLSKVIQAREQEQVKQGGYYLNQCKLLEVNIDNGFFSSATNKLNCDGTIVNIDKYNYDELVSKYKASAEK